MSNNQTQGASIEAERKAEFTYYVRWCAAARLIPVAYSEFARCANFFATRRTPAAAEIAGELPPPECLGMHFGGGETIYGYTAESVNRIVAAAIAADRDQRKRAALQEISDIGQEVEAGTCRDGGKCGVGGYCKDCTLAAPASAQPADLENEIQYLKNVAADAVPMLSHDWPKTSLLLKDAVEKVDVASKAGAQPDQRESAAVPSRSAQEIYERWHSKQANRCQIPPWRLISNDARAEWEALAAALSPAAQPAKDEQKGGAA